MIGLRKWAFHKSTAENFFMEVQRIQAQKKSMIKVINPDLLMQFIDFVMASRKIENHYKLILTLQLTCGARVSEILNLTKEDIEFQGDKAAVKIRVLKKKGVEKFRKGAVAPQVVRELKKYVWQLQPGEKLFKVSRKSVWERYQSMFGLTTHALRHSWVIYLFEKKDMKVQDVVNALQFSNWTIALRYYNTRIDKNVWTMWE